jgi:hypothetical protein
MNETRLEPIPPELADPLERIVEAGRRFDSAWTTQPNAIENKHLELEIAELRKAVEDLNDGLERLISGYSARVE